MGEVCSVNQNLYNKWRPNSFNELIGQEHVKQPLQAQLKEGKLPHAIVFFGPPGTGKTACARIVAAQLNSNPEGLVEKDSGIEGKIDNIRQLQSDAYHRPLAGDYKTFVFDEAHRITPQAYGSLLKTIEEPPSFVKFIFVTTDLSSIPDNIKSRCQIHQFLPLTADQMLPRLKEVCKAENFKLTEAALRQVALASTGSMRDALVKVELLISAQTSEDEASVSDILGVLGTKRLSDFLVAFLTENFAQTVSGVRGLNSSYASLTKLLHEVQNYLLDFRLYLVKDDVPCMISSDFSTVEQRLFKKWAGKKIPENVFNLIILRADALLDALFRAEADFRYTTNTDSVLNKLLLRIIQIWHPQKSSVVSSEI